MQPNPYIQQIVDAANRYGVDPNMALGVAHQESGINPNVQDSPAGAMGIFQLMPRTAAGLGVDPRVVSQNIDGGVRYLRQMQDRFNGDPKLTLAAYNAGPGRVDDYLQKGRQLPDETLNYVPSIMSRMGSPMSQAFTGNAPMANANPLSAIMAGQGDQQQVAQNSPALFGGNPTPVGAVGGIARMLGIGSEPELGRHLQNAGAALMSVGNFGQNGASGAAALQNAANMPLFRQRFSPISDAYGNRYLLENHTGRMFNLDGSPLSQAGQATQQMQQGQQPQGDQGQADNQPMSITQKFAQTPVARIAAAKAAQETSSKKMEALEEAAVKSQAMIDQNNYLMKLSKDPGVLQGPGMWNMMKEKLSENTNGSLGGVDLAKKAEFDKLNAQLVSSMLSSQTGIRFAAPEIKFGESASADSEKPAAANQQIYSNNIQNAKRAIAIRDLAREHIARYGVLGPEFSRAAQKYNDEHPVYQPMDDNSTSGFKILKVH
jgi:hypothetical protein